MVCRCPKFRCTSGQVDNVSVSRASFPPQESNVSRLNMIVKRQENAWLLYPRLLWCAMHTLRVAWQFRRVLFSFGEREGRSRWLLENLFVHAVDPFAFLLRKIATDWFYVNKLLEGILFVPGVPLWKTSWSSKWSSKSSWHWMQVPQLFWLRCSKFQFHDHHPVRLACYRTSTRRRVKQPPKQPKNCEFHNTYNFLLKTQALAGVGIMASPNNNNDPSNVGEETDNPQQNSQSLSCVDVNVRLWASIFSFCCNISYFWSRPSSVLLNHSPEKFQARCSHPMFVCLCRCKPTWVC